MLTIEQVPTSALKINPSNPRENDAAVDVVARSIQAFGFNNPIITDADLHIAAGHTRLKAARKLGIETVPVIRVPGLVGSQFTGYAIADNKTAEASEWDEAMLAKLVAQLNEDPEFDLSALGFDDKALCELLDADVPGPDDDEDDAPDLPAEPVTRLGDLWMLGDHRLICGDATKPEDLNRLLGDARIDCILTDPPYGVSYHSRGSQKDNWGGIKNDDLTLEALELFLRKTFDNAARVCRPGAIAYVCHGISMAGIRIAFERAFVGAGFRLSSTIVWVKQCASMGWGDYREKHECLLYGWIGDGHRRIKDRTQTTVWDIDREGNYKHPTQKPVALFSRALRNSTIRGERVFDPFVGSGTTLIACEQLGRICFAMELEPKYCDVIIQRWERRTGQKAELVRG